MENWILALGILGAVIIVCLMQNQVTFAAAIIGVAVVAGVIYLFMTMKKPPLRPVDMLKLELLRHASQHANQLGWLFISGGRDKNRFYQKFLLGKINGWTAFTIKEQPAFDPRTKQPIKTKPLPEAWQKIFVISYTPRSPGLLSDIKMFVFSLPILSYFRPKDRLFIANSDQLGINSMTRGDIVMLGNAVESIATIFDALEARDLDKDIILNWVDVEARRFTLEELINQYPAVIDKAIYGDSSHTKLIEALHGSSSNFGIDRQNRGAN